MTRDEMQAFLSSLALEDLPPRQDPQGPVIRLLKELQRQERIESWSCGVYCTGRNALRASQTVEVSVTWDGQHLLYRYVPRLYLIADVMEE